MRAKYDNIMRQMFSQSSCFGLTRLRDCHGNTPFLQACRPSTEYNDWKLFDANRRVDRIAFLLERGDSIYDRNDAGSTCLHVCLSVLTRNDLLPSQENWKEVLTYLVQNGADVQAKDARGQTASDIAYAQVICWSATRYLGSYTGDIWDAVLVSCGYDIVQFRKPYPRRAEYNERYTRQEFELLWKGQEHLCPYWDDSEWPPLSEDAGQLYRDSSQYVVCVCCYVDCFEFAKWSERSEDSSQSEWDSEEDDNDTGDEKFPDRPATVRSESGEDSPKSERDSEEDDTDTGDEKFPDRPAIARSETRHLDIYQDREISWTQCQDGEGETQDNLWSGDEIGSSAWVSEREPGMEFEEHGSRMDSPSSQFYDRSGMFARCDELYEKPWQDEQGLG